jgi:hypothetical protein
MDALNAIVRDAELHPRELDEKRTQSDRRIIYGLQQNVKKASFFIQVNNHKKELTLGRSEPYADWGTSEFDKFTILGFGLPLYCLGMTNKLAHGWTCRVEGTWGWGYPINRLHAYAVEFIDKWVTMSEADFRRELNARFADNDELKLDKTETSTIVDAIVNVLYTIKEDVSYEIKVD